MAPVEDQNSVQQLAADGADPSFGDRVGSGRAHRCAQDADAFAGEHGIKDVGELGIPVPDQELQRCHALAEVHQQIPRLLSHPGSARARRDSQKMHAAGGMLHEKQHIQPLAQQRVDAEKVGGENSLCLGGQELSPGRAIAARCGVDAGSLEDRPDRARRNRVTESGEFAVDVSTARENWIWPTFRDRVGPVALGGEEDALAEEVEFGAAVHLSFDHFDAVDGAFHGS
jgi:hypothetical protein